MRRRISLRRRAGETLRCAQGDRRPGRQPASSRFAGSQPSVSTSGGPAEELQARQETLRCAQGDRMAFKVTGGLVVNRFPAGLWVLSRRFQLRQGFEPAAGAARHYKDTRPDLRSLDMPVKIAGYAPR